MTDAEKIEEIWKVVRAQSEVDYSEDVYSDSGGNFDDAYNMGVDLGCSIIARQIENILVKK